VTLLMSTRSEPLAKNAARFIETPTVPRNLRDRMHFAHASPPDPIRRILSAVVGALILTWGCEATSASSQIPPLSGLNAETRAVLKKRESEKDKEEEDAYKACGDIDHADANHAPEIRSARRRYFIDPRAISGFTRRILRR
jgi:hypothetical protein